MAVQYRNTISGMVVTTDGPDPTYENHVRWRRVDGAGEADPQPAPFVTAAETAPAPAGNASTEDWQAYAISRGMPEEGARAATRKELRELYGG